MDAVVSARNLATNAVASAKADSSGRYLVINLQPGNYELTASVSSFSSYRQQVVVEVGVVTGACWANADCDGERRGFDSGHGAEHVCQNFQQRGA